MGITRIIFIILMSFVSFKTLGQEIKTPTPTGTPSQDYNFAYFNLPYEKLLRLEIEAQINTRILKINRSNDKIIEEQNKKSEYFEGLFSLAYSKDSHNVRNCATFLKEQAGFSLGKKIENPDYAGEALFGAEAFIKFIINKEQNAKNSKLPTLAPGYDYKVYQFVADAELAWGRGRFYQMRKKLYQALWVAYPVTSAVPFDESRKLR